MLLTLWYWYDDLQCKKWVDGPDWFTNYPLDRKLSSYHQMEELSSVVVILVCFTADEVINRGLRVLKHK